MKISVVVPMFNASRTVLKCIQALAVQDTMPDEVIIVDNNSTDDSKAIVRDAIGRFKGLNIILCEEPKKGPSAARNKGASVAAGDIIAFTDSDCIPDRSWIKGIEEAFIQNKDLDLIGGIDRISTSATTVVGKLLSASWFSANDPYVTQSLIRRKEDFFDYKFIVSFNCAFNRGFFNRIKGFDETFDIGEDFDIALRGVDAGGKIIVWNRNMVVCHMQDMSFRSLFKREVFYARGMVLNIDRHFRNNIFICTARKQYHWPNKIGLTVVLKQNIPKLFFLILVLLATAFISPVLLGLMFLLSCVYFCFKIRKRVRSNGSNLTVRETITAFFIFLGKELSEFYGCIYWSCRYKIIYM